jgi:hypothetical protein
MKTAEPNPYLRLLGRLEQTDALDRAVRAVDPVARRLVSNERLRGLFHGDATAIPLHPIMTDLPFGALFMAQFLDLFSDAGMQRAAKRLVSLGVVGAVPTALSGWAEWADADLGIRRVGVVHAGANGLAVLVFTASWVARARNQHEVGVRLARLGGGVLIVGGFLGGYLRTHYRSAEPTSG